MNRIQTMRHVAGRIWARAREHGALSGYTCAKAHALNALVRARNRFNRVATVACPCCGWQGAQFRHIDCGKFTVPQAECPHCLGHERHRMLHLFLERRPPRFLHDPAGGWLLHFAPEHHQRAFLDGNPALRVVNTDYADFMIKGHPGERFLGDMQCLPLKTKSIRAIICLHVLEHVPSDRKGIDELFRVLRDDGEAVIMVPFMMGQTETEEYGRPIPDWFDHVRGYSPLDFKDRLPPFAFDEITPASFLSPEEIARYQIPPSQVIYLCRRPGA